ncbi:GNAT family N-acetyltransferase [Streptomyces tanashiensis]
MTELHSSAPPAVVRLAEYTKTDQTEILGDSTTPSASPTPD